MRFPRDHPSMDEAQWARYQHHLVKKAERQHIVSVQHTKSQNSIGKGFLVLDSEKYIDALIGLHFCVSSYFPS